MPSDPYLMTGYDCKAILLSSSQPDNITMRVEVDVTGEGQWKTYRTFNVVAGKTERHTFPAGFSAYWVRVVASHDCIATAQLRYD